MAFTEFHYYSETLEIDVSVNVILPETRVMAQQEGKPLPTLYLLHGLSDDHTHWVRQTRLEFYARKYRLAIIMPCVNRSFYTDMAHGPRFFTYLTEELPEIMQAMFKIPADPAHTYVGGLSMGGYGALKCALQRPDLYAGAMCFSSGFFTLNRPNLLIENGYYSREELQGVIGADLQADPLDDLAARVRTWPKDQKKPLLYLACGTEDPLHPLSTEMNAILQENHFDVCYQDWPGIHDWRFWDVALEKGMIYMKDRLPE